MKKRWTTIFLICLVSLCLVVSCAHQQAVEQGPLKVMKLTKGTAFTPPEDGWYLSTEATAKVLHAIEYYRFKWEECEGNK